jgi:glycosyltransferase involved in cell wall biosynthesis
MKVVLDVDAISPPVTGIGRYVLELTRGLARDPRITDLRFFSLGRWVDDPEKLLDRRRPAAMLRPRLPMRRLLRSAYWRFSQWRFRKNARQLSGFIYHSPNFLLMPFSGLSVGTVHDLSFLRHPQFHPRERVEFLRRQLPRSLARASHIITDSEFVRSEVQELLGVDRSRTSAIALGVDPSFRQFNADECFEVLARHGLRYKQYLLIVATIEPRKNFRRLLQAFRSLPAGLRGEFPLAIAGDAGWLSADVQQQIAALVAQREAVRLGFVAEDELPMIYSGAAGFAFPSLYEGFGLPVLEAMAAGVAVVASDGTSIPELAEQACLLVDPYSIESIAAGLRTLLTDEPKRRMLEQSGLRRARQFTWDRCIERTIDVYASLQ